MYSYLVAKWTNLGRIRRCMVKLRHPFLRAGCLDSLIDLDRFL